MLIYAHRGASSDFAEGSKAAYEGAIAQGADGFECDVRLTKDQQIICYHDRNTTRLSKINLEIARTTFSELKEKVDPYRFDQLLDLAIENKKDLVIEFKHPAPTGGLIEKQVHELLNNKVAEIQKSGIGITLISFSYLATMRNKRSGYKSGLLVNNKLLAKLNPAPVVAVNIEIIRNDHGFVVDQQKRGKQIIVWTVNNEDDLTLCAELGISAVITDNPARARKLLGYS
jgi:glycerophosphoryl diester phosphodiesterase